jgi:hypothetical protein
VTSRQTFDPKAELSQSLLRESNLPMLEGRRRNIGVVYNGWE